MDFLVVPVLCFAMTLIAWIPVSGRFSDDQQSRLRPMHLLVIGSLSAIPAVILRLSAPAQSSIRSYFTAHTFFRGILIDGLTATMLPFLVLLISVLAFGRTSNPKHIALRSSLIILGYCLVDNFYAAGFDFEVLSILDTSSRSLTKLVMAPLWGILLSAAVPEGRRILSIVALTIIGSVLMGVTGFLIDMNHSYFATIPGIISLAVVFYFRPTSYILAERNIRKSNIDLTADSGDKTNSDYPRPVRKPSHKTFSLMKQARYSDARIAAERYLERNTDLYLFAWHAILRWIDGEKSCKLIFLQRYESLGEQNQQKIRDHLEEYLSYYADEVSRWIKDLERSYYPKARAAAV